MPKSLQDVAEVHYGKSQNGVADKYGHFPIIGTGGFLGYARKLLFSGPAIVVGRKGTLNNPIYSPDDFWAVDTTYAVVPKENIHPKWLYFTLKNARLELLNEATGVPSLSRDRLFRVPVQDIEFPEQFRIAYVLDTIDKAIAQTEAVIAKLKQVRAGMLHDLLRYGLDEHGQIRDPIAHPEQFKDSPLGLIPREWDVGTVKSLAINRDSKRIPVKQADRESRHGLYPYYGASGIIDHIDDFIFEGDFVLIGEDGENLRSRQLPLAFIATGKFWVNNHAHILEPLPETDVRFLATILENQDFIPWLLGSAQPKLTQRNLEIVPLRIPLPDEQKRISDSLEKCDIKIDAEIIELEKLKSLKTGLQDDLLTGRVRVPETIMEGAESA